MRGILQHVASAQKWLQELADTLRRGKQKRSHSTLQRDIETRLMGRQHLSEVLRFSLGGTGRVLTLTWDFDQTALDTLERGRGCSMSLKSAFSVYSGLQDSTVFTNGFSALASFQVNSR